MAKRNPERDEYPSEYFEGNPFDGYDAEGLYRELRWGNEPTETFEIGGIEDMATLGELALLDLGEYCLEWGDDETPPFVAVGLDTNLLFIVPRDKHGSPVDVPSGPYEVIGRLYQTDYYSDKGGEDSYYYHEHEEPYPLLAEHKASGVCVILPETVTDGRRSYAVSREGIIG